MKKHKYSVGQLVRLVTNDFQDEKEDLTYLHGSVMFIVRLTRDCDNTPLYVLSANKNACKMEEYNYLMANMHGGYNESCLELFEE